MKEEQFGYVNGTILVRCDLEFDRLAEGTYVLDVHTSSKRRRERRVTPLSIGFEEYQISFEINDELQLVENAIRTRGLFDAVQTQTKLRGKTVHVEAVLTVHEAIHSCLVTLDEDNLTSRTRFNRNASLPLPMPSNATAMSFKQFLGEQ